MKISKIACVAILGISLSTTSLFAKISDENDAFTKAFTNQHDRDKEYKAVNDALTELKKIGYDKLATWDDTKKADEFADNGIHKKIFDTLKKIGEQIKNNTTELPKITAKDGNKEISIEVKKSDNSAVLRLTVKNIANINGYDDKSVDLDDNFELKKNEFSNLFSAANKTLWKNLITEFENKHKELHDKRVKDAALAFAKSNIGDEDKMDAYVKYQDKLTSALEKEIADKQAAGQSAQDEINKLNEFYKAATDKTLTDASIKNYETKLNENPKKIKKAQEELPKLQNAKNEKDKEFKDELDKLKNGNDKDKVTPETTAKEVIQQEKAMDAIKNTLDSLTLPGVTNVREARINALKSAIKNGVPVKSDGQIFKTAKEFEDFANSKPDKDFKQEATDAKTAVDDAKQALAAVKEKAVASETAATNLTNKEKEITQAEEEMVQAKQNINLASKARAKAISHSASFNTQLSELFSSFSSLALENQTVQNIMSNTDTKELIQGIQELHSTLDESSKTIGKSYSTDVVIFNQSLSTNTRLAKLSNPFNENLALAYAIKNVEGEKFADNGNSLSSVIREYTNRYNYDNNLWGNVFGGKAKVKNSPNTNLYGFTLGYDKAFDNTIVGGFFTLGKSQSNSDLLKNKANIYSFGVYSRSYFGENELDAKFAYGVAKSKLEISNSLIGLNKGDFDGKFFDISVDYGRVFDLSNAKFIKPIIGLEYTNLKNDSFNANGGVDIKFAKTSAKTLSAKLATEFRVYDDNGDYFYITPGIERELSKSVDDMNIRFANANKDIKFDADKKKYTYFAFKTGAEFKVTNNLSTNINFGVKARSKNQFYNGTLGLSYKF